MYLLKNMETFSPELALDPGTDVPLRKNQKFSINDIVTQSA